MRRIWIPQVIVTLMLLWALYPDNPYGYYTLLRVVCCAVFAYLAYQAHDRGIDPWVWILGVAAVVYNPIVPLPLGRPMWLIVNIVTVGLAGVSIAVLRKPMTTDNR